MIVCREIFSPAGKLLLAADTESASLTGLWITGQHHFGSTLPGKPVFQENVPLFETVERWLERYFAGERPDPGTLPLAPAGTPFCQLIWQLLRKIPYGQLTTYGALAKKAAAILGKTSMSAQAIGAAVGRNPIAIVIPCHRVVGSNGSLTGYAAGLALKEKLLLLERGRSSFSAG